MASTSDRDGWRAVRGPRAGAEAFVVTPFTRLARAHAFAVAGDTLIAIALAGSLFFSIAPDDARWKVVAYLTLTMAPFAVVAPLIGPTLDRVAGGRRWMVVGSGIARALVCIVMIDDVDSLLLFPEAFALLVLSKGYHVAKSALVPTVVRDDRELVQANSKLSLLSGIVGFVAFVPGVIASAIADAEGVLVLAVGVFALAAIFGLAIPATQVAPLPATAQERAELRGGTIVLAASAMGLMRGIVGFLTLLLAFDLRGDDAPPWHFGVVLALSAIGSLLGALLAPRLRQSAQEENILLLLLGGAFACGLAAAWLGGLTGAALLALAVGMSSTGGKLAFDAIVQRDAPDANRGRSFARFETRFQLAWVIGALPPALVDIPARLGFLVVSGVAAFATVSYVLGERTLRQRAHAPTVIQARPPDEPTAIAPRDPDATNEIAPDPTIIE